MFSDNVSKDFAREIVVYNLQHSHNLLAELKRTPPGLIPDDFLQDLISKLEAQIADGERDLAKIEASIAAGK